MLSFPYHPTPCYSSPSPQFPDRPQCVMFPSLCPCVLIVQHPLTSENMWCLVFCSCVSLLRMMVSSFIHVPHKDMNSSFLWLHSILWCICATFSLSSLIDGHLGWFQVFCYCELCCNKYVCACVFINRMIYNPLGIYPVMGLLDQMAFLFLGTWGSATVFSTMFELIYTPTNSVKVFLFLHILSSICCLLIF